MRKSIKKRLLFVFGGAITATAIFLTGLYIGQARISCEVCPPQDIDFSLFWESYQVLKNKYVAPGEIKEEDILYGAISGMIEAVGDPHTVFMRPDDTNRFLEDISGKFEGVGMEIGIREEQLQVVAPLEGTPAQKAGLRAGDRILAVDGESTANFNLEEAVSKIRGPRGSEVVLTIGREAWEKPQEISVIRDVINVPSLRWELVNQEGEPDNEGTIAYVKFYNFTEKVGVDWAAAAVRIFNSPADRIILDLRNNPGGYLEMARNLAGYFIKRGEVVVIEDTGEEQKEFRAQGQPLFLDYPIVVLINQGSASASEILAGALRDNRGVQLTGETSFGKGSVQSLETLSKGASLKVTIARWLTPKGETIEDSGLEPDVEVEFTEEAYSSERDPQLEKAVEMVKEL